MVKTPIEEGKKLENALDKADGPFTRRFEAARKEQGWSRNVYHKGSVNGNGCYSFLKHRAKLWGIFRPLTVIGPDGVQYTFVAEEYERKLHVLLNKFEETRRLFHRNDPLCRHEVKLLEVRYVDWAFAFAEELPDMVPLPKMHMMGHALEKAVALAEEGLSPGFNTEAPIESHHPLTNALQKQYKGTGKQQEGLKTQRIFEQLSAKSHPSVSSFRVEEKLYCEKCNMPKKKDNDGNRCTCNKWKRKHVSNKQ